MSPIPEFGLADLAEMIADTDRETAAAWSKAMKLKQFDIKNVIGSVYKTPENQKLLIERDLGDDHIQITTVPEGKLFKVENPMTGDFEIPTGTWIEQELATGGLIKLVDEKGRLVTNTVSTSQYDRDEMMALDEKLEAKMHVVNGLLERGIFPDDPNLGRYVDEIWDPEIEEKFGQRPCNSTVRRWYGKVSGDLAQLHELFSRSGRCSRASRLKPEVERVIDEALERYISNRGYKIADVRADVVTKLREVNKEREAAGFSPLDIPSKETIRRRVNETYNKENYARKYGDNAARRKFEGGGTSVNASRILHIGLMDDTVVDLVTCLDGDRGIIAGRPYLTILLDLYSRCVLGYAVSFIPPTTQKAADLVGKSAAGQTKQIGRATYNPSDPAMRAAVSLQCVKAANDPKTKVRADRLARFPALATLSGRFDEIHTDNGVNYVSPSFTGALADIGVSHVIMPVKKPTYKAVIERWFRSFNTYLIDKLPGSTLDPSLLRKLGIDPQNGACVTITELHQLIEEFLFLYHVSYHSGIDGIPIQRWERSAQIHGRQKIENVRDLAIAAGATVNKKRITANGGVRMFGLTWKGKNLSRVINALVAKEPHRARLSATASVTTNIKYNPENLLHVHAQCGSEWLELECTQPEYAENLTLWQHKQTVHWAKNQHLEFISEEDRLAARAALNQTLREAFPDLDARERRAAARMLSAKPQIEEPTIEFAVAEPRHDGMGPVIDIDLAMIERQDLDRKPSLPAKTKKAKAVTDAATDEAVEDDPEEDFNPILQAHILDAEEDGPSVFDDLDDGFEEYR